MTPCLFSFDMCDVAFEGFTTGRKWNGFDEVAVNSEQLSMVMVWLGQWPEQDPKCAAEEHAGWRAAFDRGELAVLAGWTTYLIDRDNLDIAQRFTLALRNMLGAHDFTEMRRRNAEEANTGVCHSHDYCDANMIMWAALCGHYGRDENEDFTDEDLARMNDAWDLARSLNLIEAA